LRSINLLIALHVAEQDLKAFLDAPKRLLKKREKAGLLTGS